MTRECESCGKPFTTKPSKVAKGQGRYCSLACSSLARWALQPAGKGYVFARQPEHPLADSKGVVRVHRQVLFDALGRGPHPCHWCGTPVTFRAARESGSATGPGALVVDHLDEDKRNNTRANLVPSCHKCNVWRKPPKRDTVTDGEIYVVRPTGRVRGVRLRCPVCETEFIRVKRDARRRSVNYCSRGCWKIAISGSPS